MRSVNWSSKRLKESTVIQGMAHGLAEAWNHPWP
jgi:hypothetical protein